MSWWIEYITTPNGGLATPKVVSAAAAPAATGNIEWVYGPYPTQADAQKASVAPGAPPPPGAPQVSAQGGITSEGGGSGSLTGSLGGSLLAPLFQPNIWIRVGEVILGLVLLAVGVARLTHAVPIATKIAKTAGAVSLA